jgi:predicted RNA binding protein YcfA (HicA-like mRNA interferase family)
MARATFARLEKFLLHLGFHSKTNADSHLVFEHRKARASVILRAYDPNETVEHAVIAYVRHTLDEWGILSREQFDEQWKERAVAS